MAAAIVEGHEIQPNPGMEDAPGSGITELLNPFRHDPYEQAMPESFYMGALGDARFRVVEPIRVSTFLEGDQYVAEAEELNEFGFGADIVTAVRDLQKALVNLYSSLDHDESRLGDDLAMTLKVLRHKVHRQR